MVFQLHTESNTDLAIKVGVGVCVTALLENLHCFLLLQTFSLHSPWSTLLSLAPSLPLSQQIPTSSVETCTSKFSFETPIISLQGKLSACLIPDCIPNGSGTHMSLSASRAEKRETLSYKHVISVSLEQIKSTFPHLIQAHQRAIRLCCISVPSLNSSPV